MGVRWCHHGYHLRTLDGEGVLKTREPMANLELLGACLGFHRIASDQRQHFESGVAQSMDV